MFDRQFPTDPHGEDPEAVVETSVEVEIIPADEDVDSTEEKAEETVNFDELPFNVNLAAHLPQEILDNIGAQLKSEVDDDELSRADWEDSYETGLDLLGFKEENRTLPWAGSCGLYSTMLAESVVRFQSNATMEIFPPAGPVKTKIIGRVTKEREQQAQRVQEDMNYALTCEMEDYVEETEKLLWALALCGSAFRKVYADPITGAPQADYVPAKDFIMPYGSSSLAKAPRYAHKFQITKNRLKELQSGSVYLDIKVDESEQPPSDLEEKIDENTGIEKAGMVNDFVRLIEVYATLNIKYPGIESEDGVAIPYIVTIDANSTVLSIYRNWKESDETRKKIVRFSSYSYIPGEGAYGYGLIHMIGNPSRTTTILQRQLIDAGVLSNLPGGLKASGLRMTNDNTPIRPGEWREANTSGMKLSESFMPLPYKEPSLVLLQLMDKVEAAGQRLGSIADVEIGDIGSQAPVGTTLAIMERAMKVMSAVQKRLHASLGREFKILAEIIRETRSDEYDYDVDAPRAIKKSDYDERIDVIPVSDPNAATLSQRITQYQTMLQMSAQAPQVYDLREVHRRILMVLGIRDVDQLIPDPEDIKPSDPVSENMAIVTGKPVKAFEFENHEAHMASHQGFIEDPQMRQVIGQNPNAQQIAGAMQAHIAEHYAFLYRTQIEQELGIPLPPLGDEIPGDIQSNMAMVIAQAQRQLTGKHQQEAQAAEIVAKQQDPVIQMQQKELELDAEAIKQKDREAQIEAQTELEKAKGKEAIERLRIQSQERMASEKSMDDLSKFMADMRMQMKELAVRVMEINSREGKKDEPTGEI